MYDIIIIGGGPAGISASLYVKRANKKVLLFYHGKAELEKAEVIENYYGFPGGISGEELYNNGIKQARTLGVEIEEKEIMNIEMLEDNTFKVSAEDEEYYSSSIIIATGNKKLRPQIKGIEEFDGRGISYCAICDGFFYRNKDVAIIGNGKFSISEANHLKSITNNVKILTNGEEFKEDINDVEVINKKIKEISGDNRVNKIEFEDGEILNIDGVFIAIGEAGSVDFAKKIGIMTKNDNIIVDEKMKTNIEGVFSCGNATGGLLQVSKAVYEGSVAGLSAIEYLNRN